MNQKLGSIARQEILKAMTGLGGTAAKAEAVRLAEDHNVDVKHIYRMTKKVRKGERKQRSDAGQRTFKLVKGTDVFYAASFVIGGKLDPQEALDIARARGYTNLPSLEYFQKLLRENNLGRKQRRTPKRAFRAWEAENPGDMFQIDVTALKVRWHDEKTRRIQHIEGVDKNHPQMDPTKLRVWQIMLVDDHSRRRFLRYITSTHITSAEMVRFMCEAYTELGVPLTCYTDNGSEFKGYHTTATKILNTILRNDGGYRHLTHMPGNSQASGKVEVAHQFAEKMDRLIGVAVSEDQNVTLEMLNVFADRICDHYNNRVHRATGESPMFRWTNTRVTLRKLPAEIIKSALLVDRFPALLDASLTVKRDKKLFRIPDDEVFKQFIGQEVSVVIPKDIDLIFVTLPNGEEYEIEKVIATPDRAGDFKSVADTNAQTLTKQLKELRKEDIKGIKAKSKLTGQIAPVPHLNVEIEIPATNIHAFPHAERTVGVNEIAAVVPVPQITYSGKDIGYWQAVADYAGLFDGGIPEAKQFLLTLFPDAKGSMPSLEIEAAIDRRSEPGAKTTGFLRAVS
jgi:hypothetical protein